MISSVSYHQMYISVLILTDWIRKLLSTHTGSPSAQGGFQKLAEIFYLFKKIIQKRGRKISWALI